MSDKRHPILGWDITCALVIAVMGVVGVWDAESNVSAGLGPVITVLAALAVTYVALGRQALKRAMRDEEGRPADAVFLGITVVLIGASTAVTPDLATLQAIGYPFLWVIARRYRDAVIWNVVLASLVAVGCIISFTRAEVASGVTLGLGVGVLSLTFALFMGTWITRIFAQGERYRLLAAELQAAQAEVAVLSQAAGAAAEREQLSRELHDTFTQTLTGLVMLSEQAVRALDADDTDRAKERLLRVEEAARTAGGEARALVAGTHPLGDGGLEPAIERVAESLRHDFGFTVDCSLTPLPLARDLQVVVLRAAQEGLANVRRHSNARRVWVTLSATPDEAVFTVADDGVGPSAAAMAMSSGVGSSFGLRGLRDRAQLVGGSVQLTPRGGGGSQLQVRLPVNTAATSAARDNGEHDG